MLRDMRLMPMLCQESFDFRDVPTPRFYPPPPDHPTSTCGCLCGGRRGRFGIRSVDETFGNQMTFCESEPMRQGLRGGLAVFHGVTPV